MKLNSRDNTKDKRIQFCKTLPRTVFLFLFTTFQQQFNVKSASTNKFVSFIL